MSRLPKLQHCKRTEMKPLRTRLFMPLRPRLGIFAHDITRLLREFRRISLFANGVDLVLVKLLAVHADTITKDGVLGQSFSVAFAPSSLDIFIKLALLVADLVAFCVMPVLVLILSETSLQAAPERWVFLCCVIVITGGARHNG